MLQDDWPKDDWFEATADVEPFDARPIIAQGGHPLADVIDRARAVTPGGFLVLDVPFDPVPLRGRLLTLGFPSVARPLAAGHWRVVFRHGPAVDAPTPAEADNGAGPLDVRDLEPPEPLIRILRRIDAGRDDMLIVRLRREPLLLLPELADRGWSWEPLKGEPGEIRWRLFRIT